ncbi:MAG: hypothetical protein H0X38_18955 [Planctomycetes bacterium]|nr:hypothetical protein [Planctomycetota bacterium]
MKIALPILLLAMLAAPVLRAEDATPPAVTPPATPAAAATPATPAAADANGNGGNRQNGFMRRMIADNPELKDVDPNTPEGQDKIREVMQKRMEANAPRIRQRMAEQQAATHTELNKQFAMTSEEFTAIEPLLTRVENLRMQKGLVDRSGGGRQGRGGPGGFGGPGGPGGPGGFGGMTMNPQLMLGDTPMEPTVKDIMDAGKALKALVDDTQANAAETTAAIARVRKAREAFAAVLTKAQDDLRAVLSQRQEAILLDRGTLE